MSASIHPTAIVETDRLGDGSSVREHASLGSEVVLDGDAEVGAGARLQGKVTVGASASIGANAVLGRSGAEQEIRVGRGSRIGANVSVAPGAAIGRGAVVQAGSVVETDVPAFAVVRGSPARIVGYVDTHFREAHFMQHRAPSPLEAAVETALIHYASVPAASPAVAREIRRAWLDGVGSKVRWAATENRRDPYAAYLAHYGWGSNSVKAEQGSILLETAALTDNASRQTFTDAASHYIHYLHGTNPLGKVYLSNMGEFGATNSVARFYHSWFEDRTPPPGYLVGGPDQDYSWDERCPQVSAACGARPLSPPAEQPPQKSYLDFSAGWPLNSWQITEPDIGYQTAYIRLLARFVH